MKIKYKNIIDKIVKAINDCDVVGILLAFFIFVSLELITKVKNLHIILFMIFCIHKIIYLKKNKKCSINIYGDEK